MHIALSLFQVPKILLSIILYDRFLSYYFEERENINEINFEKDLYPEYNAHFPTSAKSMEITVSYGKLEKRYKNYCC